MCLSSWLLNKQCPTDKLAQSDLMNSIIGALVKQQQTFFKKKQFFFAAKSGLFEFGARGGVRMCDQFVVFDWESGSSRSVCGRFAKGYLRDVGGVQSHTHKRGSGGQVSVGILRATNRCCCCCRLQNYSRMYVELCETLLPEITKNPSYEGLGNLDSFKMILLVLSHHDYSVRWVAKSLIIFFCGILARGNDIQFVVQVIGISLSGGRRRFWSAPECV